MAVTRQAAIEELVDAYMQRDQEFCVGSEEIESSRELMFECFEAIGVSREEVMKT